MNNITSKDFADIVVFLNNHQDFIWDKDQSLWRSVNYADRNAEIAISPQGFELFLFVDPPPDDDNIVTELTATILNLDMLRLFI